jgi:hypothetical protein
MPEVLYFLLEELALRRIDLQVGFSEPLERFPQVEQVLFECTANHDHIVWVHDI